MANQVDFKILPSDQFSVYSPSTRSDKIITYFTLLSKLRGDILTVSEEDDPNDIVSAYYTTSGGTQTLHLVKADGSEVTASISTAGSTENQNASTGIISGGNLTAAIGGTTFSVASGKGQIVTQTLNGSNVETTITPVSWDAFTNVTPTNLTSQPFTYIYIDENGALQQQNGQFTDAQYKQYIIIGHVCHIDLATINLVTSDQNVAYGTGYRLLELIQAFGPIKKSGLAIGPNDGNLSVNRNSGEGFIIGSNYQTDQFEPDNIQLAAKDPALLCRIYKDGSGGYVFDNNSGSFYNFIDPTKYDNGSGTLQTVNNNQWTVQRLYTFPSAPDDIICYYGIKIYNSQGDALANMMYEPFTEADITLFNSIFLGYVIVRGGATNLSSISDATFIQAGVFRGTGTGGGSTTNLRLEDLSDVTITSVTDNQFLIYDSTTSEWINETVGIFKTVTNGTTPITASSYTDTLTITGTSPVTVTNTALSKTIDISVSNGNLSEVTSSVLTITGGTGAVLGSGTTIQVAKADTDTDGYLSSGDWNTFNGKEPAFTKGNLTEATSSVLTITGGTGAVIGSGTSIQVSQAGASSSGYLSFADWNTFNGKQDAITLTTTGSSGAATLVGSTLNIPQYTDQFTGTVTSVDLTAGAGISVTGGPITTSGSITVTNTAPDQIVALTAGTGITTSGTYPNFTITNAAPDQTVALTAGTGISVTGTYPNFTITNTSTSSGGTVTNVSELTLGTTGTDLSSTVANSTTTPVITLNVPTASATNRGALSSGDWTTFNGKQDAITLTTTGTSGAATLVGATLNIPQYTDQFTGTVTSVNLTAGDRIAVSGGPITTSGSITVTHGTASGADFTTAQDFEARVIADGGTFEALGDVAIAIGSLDDAASPSSTDYNDGVVVQNIAVDNYGHVLGVSATDLDDRYAQAAFKNVAVSGESTVVADAIEDTLTLVAGTGISITTNATTDSVTISNTAVTSIASFAAYSTQNLSLTTAGLNYEIDFDVQSIIDSSIYSHDPVFSPASIQVLEAGTYEISMGYMASNGSNQISTVVGQVAINGAALNTFSFLQLNTSTVGQYVGSAFNTYIYTLSQYDVIQSYFTAGYTGGATGTVTINPSSFDGSTYITIKKIG